MRTDPPDPGRVPREPRGLLAEFSQGANPRALMPNPGPVTVAVALTMRREADVRPAREFIQAEAWPHWGIND